MIRRSSASLAFLMAICLVALTVAPAIATDRPTSVAFDSAESDGPPRADSFGRREATARIADPFGGPRSPAGPRVAAPTKIPIASGERPDRPPKAVAGVPSPTSAFFVDAEPYSGFYGAGGNPVDGIVKMYTAPSSTISAAVGDHPELIWISVYELPFGPNDWWQIGIEAPPGEVLQLGVYEGAVDINSNGAGQPAMAFGGNGAGCEPLDGRFEILEIARAGDGSITSLALTFEPGCSGPYRVFGELRLNSTVAMTALDFDPIRLHYGTVAIGASHGSAFEILNTGSTDLLISDYSIAGPDAARFAVGAESCTAAPIVPAATCSVSVDFRPTAVGPREASLTFTDSTARGTHTVQLLGQATIPNAAAPSGRGAAESLTFGDGLADADHDEFYICSHHPCVQPADPSVAVGPDHVVQTAGALIRVTRRNGTGTMTAATLDWFAQPDDVDGFGDVSVVYHPGTDRYFGASTHWYCGPEAVGFLDLAVSETGDPRGVWFVYSWAFNTVPTYPVLGVSADKVVAAIREVSIQSVCDQDDPIYPPYFEGSSVVVVDTDDFASLPNTLYAWGTPRNENVSFWRPANAPADTTGTIHMISGSIFPYINIGYGRITGHVTPFTVKLAGKANLGSILPAAYQPLLPYDAGGQIGSGSSGNYPGAAVWQDGRLAFTIAQTCTPTDDTVERSCVRVVELIPQSDPTALPTIRQDVVLSEAGHDLFHGGLARSGAGDLHVVVSISSSSGFVGSRHVYQRADDAVGTFSRPVLIRAGEAAHTGDAWGFIHTLAQDPVDAFAVWQGNQFASADGSWATAVSQIRTVGATFKATPPARILDTRTGNGLSGRFTANTPRSFQVTGRGGIPANAIAVTGNLTVTGQSAAGYVSLTPTATATPKTSTLNMPAGDNRANNVTIPVGPGGKLAAVYKAGPGSTTHLIFDVTGYFVRNSAGSTYFPFAPVRLLDTRVGNGLTGPFTANTPQTWAVAGRGGVPSGAVAITANLTVTGQSSAGYASVTPTPTASPTTSTINFPLGDTRANGLTVPLGPNGTLSAVYKAGGGTTHLILDVTGYYLASPDGARYVPLTPARTLDSRFNNGLNGTFQSSVPRTLTIDGRRGIPMDAAAITGNLTIVGQTGSGYVSITTTPTATPLTSTLNAPAADIRANGVTVPIASNGTDSLVYVSKAGKVTHLILDLTGYFR